MKNKNDTANTSKTTSTKQNVDFGNWRMAQKDENLEPYLTSKADEVKKPKK